MTPEKRTRLISCVRGAPSRPLRRSHRVISHRRPTVWVDGRVLFGGCRSRFVNMLTSSVATGYLPTPLAMPIIICNWACGQLQVLYPSTAAACERVFWVCAMSNQQWWFPQLGQNPSHSIRKEPRSEAHETRHREPIESEVPLDTVRKSLKIKWTQIFAIMWKIAVLVLVLQAAGQGSEPSGCHDVGKQKVSNV